MFLLFGVENNRFLDPIFKGDYPEVMKKHAGNRLPKFTSDEITKVQGSVDFIGINHYTSRWVTDGKPPINENGTNHYFDQWLDCSGDCFLNSP